MRTPLSLGIFLLAAAPLLTAAPLGTPQLVSALELQFLSDPPPVHTDLLQADQPAPQAVLSPWRKGQAVAETLCADARKPARDCSSRQADGPIGAAMASLADDVLAALGWSGLIYLGSFCAAVFVMLIAWWRVRRSVAVENRAEIAEWDRF